MPLKIGVLALQGDVSEHIRATKEAAQNMKTDCHIIEVRTKEDLTGLSGIILPGGESTVFQKLLEREGMFEEIKKVPAIFGTCAGAIMLSKIIHNKAENQQTLQLMDIEIDRNGYGRQSESFEDQISTSLGKLNAIFIRAPRIKKVSPVVAILAKRNDETIACEQKIGNKYYLAACFHPELSSNLFHEYFLSAVMSSQGLG
ncbi:MAG: pyridoxal 5'-phosphate synthase glutaminase subunit PdxT [Candidatus Bilamarchaeum sp.]|jgi:5'-phosphate synthase pdxT subunit